MPTTNNRSYITDGHGLGVNTWDATLNTVFNQIDQNFGAVSNIALSNVNVTLNPAQYVCGTLRFSGILTGNVIVTFPSVSGWWVCENVCTGNFYVQLTCGAGNKICVPPGESVDVLTDGSNFRYRNFGRVGSELYLDTAAVPVWITNCTVPPYLLCDGSAFSSGTYPALAAILGGTTLPDARGRARFALNGGTGRLTTTGGIDGNTLLAAGGDGDGLVIGTTNLPAVTLATAITAGQGSHVHVNSKPVFNNTSASTTGPVQGWNLENTVAATLPAMVGTTPLGGDGTALASVPPGYVGGITLIRAA